MRNESCDSDRDEREYDVVRMKHSAQPQTE